MQRKSVKSTFGKRGPLRMSQKIQAAAGKAALTQLARMAPMGPPAGSVQVFGRSSFSEVKSFDLSVTSPSVADPYGLLAVTNVVGSEPGNAFTGMTWLNLMQQGNRSFDRIGTKVNIRSLHFSANLYLVGASASRNVARVMIVHDASPNGAFPLIGDVLSANISGGPSFHVGVNMANRDRFTILRDRLYAVDSDSSAQLINIREFIRCNVQTQLNGTADPMTIANCSTGAIYLIAFAASSGVATDYCTLNHIQCRIRYID